MEQLGRPFEIDRTGLPKYLPEETLLHGPTADVSLYDGEEKSQRFVRGRAYLTTHRVLWTNAGSGEGRIAFELVRITRFETEAGFFTRSPKLVLHFGARASAVAGHVKLSFKAGGRDAFEAQLRDALGTRAWAVPPTSAQPPGAPARATATTASQASDHFTDSR